MKVSQWLPGWANGRERMPDVLFYALIFAVAYFIVWYFKRLRTANITEGMTPKQKAEDDMSICYDGTYSGEGCKSCEDVRKHYRSKGWDANGVFDLCDTTNKKVGLQSGGKSNLDKVVERGSNIVGLPPGVIRGAFEEATDLLPGTNTVAQQAVDAQILVENEYNRKDLKNECRPRLMGEKLQKVNAAGDTHTVDSKAGIYKTDEKANAFVDRLNRKLGTDIKRQNGMCYNVTDYFEISDGCTPPKFVEYVHPSNDNKDNTMSNAVQQSLDNKVYYDDYRNIIDMKEDNADDEPDFKSGDVRELKSFMESPPAKPSDSFSMYYKNSNNDRHGFIRLEHKKCCIGENCGGGGPPQSGMPPIVPPQMPAGMAGMLQAGMPQMPQTSLQQIPTGMAGMLQAGMAPIVPQQMPAGTAGAGPTNLEPQIMQTLRESAGEMVGMASVLLQPSPTQISAFTQQRALREGLQAQDDDDSGCCSTDCEAIPHGDIYKDDRTGENLQKRYNYICKYKEVDGFSPRVKKMCNWWNKLTDKGNGCEVDLDENLNPKPYIAQKIAQWKCDPKIYLSASQLYDEDKGENDDPFHWIKRRGGDLCKP